MAGPTCRTSKTLEVGGMFRIYLLLKGGGIIEIVEKNEKRARSKAMMLLNKRKDVVGFKVEDSCTDSLRIVDVVGYKNAINHN